MGHLVGGEKLPGLLVCLGGKEGVEIVLGQVLQGGGCLPPEHGGQFRPWLISEDLELGGLVQVRVDEQDLFPALGQGKGQVRRHGGLALVFRCAGNEKDLAAPLLGRVLHLHGQPADFLGKEKACCRHGDKQTLVGPLELGFQGFVLHLVVENGEKPGVDFMPEGGGGLHRVAPDGEEQKHDDHQPGSQKEPLLADAHQVHRVGGRGGDGGAVELFQDDVLKGVL